MAISSQNENLMIMNSLFNTLVAPISKILLKLITVHLFQCYFLAFGVHVHVNQDKVPNEKDLLF